MTEFDESATFIGCACGVMVLEIVSELTAAGAGVAGVVSPPLLQAASRAIEMIDTIDFIWIFFIVLNLLF
jgi:hypothetical protein